MEEIATRRGPQFRLSALALLGVLAVAAACLFATQTASAAAKPNIVVIMADDQRQDDMVVMNKVKSLMADRGTTFANSYVSYSLCCPSRVSFLTGQYMHNHDITWNFWPEGGYFKFKHQADHVDPSTGKHTYAWDNILPNWLRGAGYTTGLIGKYLNSYGEKDPSTGFPGSGIQNPREIPPGWDQWAGGVDPTTYSYYGYTLNVNGKLKTFGKCQRVDLTGKKTRSVLDGCADKSQTGKDGTEYQTDVEATYAENYIKRRKEFAGRPSGKPFFLWLTPTAPHTQTPTGMAEGAPAIPPNRYLKTFAKLALPITPAINEADVSDKPLIRDWFPWFIPMNDPTNPRKVLRNIGFDKATRALRGRRGAVKGLDDMVGRVVKALKDSGQYDNTIIVYTSDNGWLLGEHRIVAQKFFGFEESIRVPLVISGPGFNNAGGRTVNGQAINVDLAPTLLEAAGATDKADRPLDGIPLQDLIARPGDWTNRTWNVETGPNPNNHPEYVGAGNNCANGNAPNPNQIWFSGSHNSRYHLEIVTGGCLDPRYELYDLKTDPMELTNLVKDPAYGHTLNPHYTNVLNWMVAKANSLSECVGTACRVTDPAPDPLP